MTTVEQFFSTGCVLCNNFFYFFYYEPNKVWNKKWNGCFYNKIELLYIVKKYVKKITKFIDILRTTKIFLRATNGPRIIG